MGEPDSELAGWPSHKDHRAGLEWNRERLLGSLLSSPNCLFWLISRCSSLVCFIVSAWLHLLQQAFPTCLTLDLQWFTPSLSVVHLVSVQDSTHLGQGPCLPRSPTVPNNKVLINLLLIPSAQSVLFYSEFLKLYFLQTRSSSAL